LRALLALALLASPGDAFAATRGMPGGAGGSGEEPAACAGCKPLLDAGKNEAWIACRRKCIGLSEKVDKGPCGPHMAKLDNKRDADPREGLKLADKSLEVQLADVARRKQLLTARCAAIPATDSKRAAVKQECEKGLRELDDECADLEARRDELSAWVVVTGTAYHDTRRSPSSKLEARDGARIVGASRIWAGESKVVVRIESTGECITIFRGDSMSILTAKPACPAKSPAPKTFKPGEPNT
jgi:hypothetical protein